MVNIQILKKYFMYRVRKANFYMGLKLNNWIIFCLILILLIFLKTAKHLVWLKRIFLIELFFKSKMWHEIQNSLDFCCAQTSPGQIIKHEKKVLIALKKFWKFLAFIMNVKG